MTPSTNSTGSPDRVARQSDVFISTIEVFNATTVADPATIVSELQLSLDRRYENYEIIVVDNGMTDEGLRGIIAILDSVPCIRVLRLSRRFTNDTAVFAGLEAAIGDYMVVAEPDSDKVDVIERAIGLARDGHDIVQGMSTSRLGRGLFGAARSAFYWANRHLLNVDMPENATYLTVLSRRAANSLLNVSRNHRYLRHLVRHVGYNLAELPYEPVVPARRRTLFSGYREAAEMITSYSTRPLRFVTFIGVIGALLNLAYAIYVVILNIVSARLQPGWTTTSLQLSLMFFIVCVILAVQSEYTGRILAESRRDPSYFIMDDLESTSIIADRERRNVAS